MPATSGYPHHEGRGYSLPRPFFSPLLTEVRGIGILRTSPTRSSKKFGIAPVQRLWASRYRTGAMDVGRQNLSVRSCPA